MKVATLSLVFGAALASVCGAQVQSPSRRCAGSLISAAAGGANETGPLFLTPLIEKHPHSDAQQRSRVKGLPQLFGGATAHSGYITVNQGTESHLFFLLIKSESKASNAPLILWLQEGPGASSLFAQFIEHGPVGINKDGCPYRRGNTLQKDHDILYLDQPVGAGYSFTKKKSYAMSLEDMAEHMEQFLRQFLKLFAEYCWRDFYIAGESYGVRPAVALAARLHRLENKKPLGLNLKGVICGAGLFREILKQADVSDYLLQLGLVDQRGYQVLRERIQNITDLQSRGFSQMLKTMLLLYHTFGTTRDLSRPKLFFNLTGYFYQANAHQPLEPAEFGQFRKLMELSSFKNAVHVGTNATFRISDTLIQLDILKDGFRSISTELELLLKNYRVLVYAGQLDILLSTVATEEFLRCLRWPGAGEFATGNRRPWWGDKDDRRLVGYVTEGGNLTYVSLRMSGHFPFYDQPKDAYEMVSRFIKEEPVVSTTFDPVKGHFVQEGKKP